MQHRTRYLLIIILNILLLSNCSLFRTSKPDSAPKVKLNPHKIKDAEPKHEPKSKYGNPSSYKVFGQNYYPINSSKNFTQTGMASWYGTKFHGRKTSSGEIYDMYAMTAAHKTLPLPTYAKVTNLENNKTIIVKINDRGPFHDNRIVDLSYAAATKLGILGKGTAKVKLSAINPGDHELSDELITMQIGAFSNRAYAEDLTEAASNIFKHPIKMSSIVNKNTNIYKVHIGPFPSNDYDAIKSKLNDLNINNPIIIARVQK